MLDEPLDDHAVRRLCRAILREGYVVWTTHALDEMEQDDLDELDCRNVIWAGADGGCDPEGPRGTWRYRRRSHLEVSAQITEDLRRRRVRSLRLYARPHHRATPRRDHRLETFMSNTCRRCGGTYGPPESVVVPLRALPHVLVAGIEGRRCAQCGDLAYGIPRMDDLLRVVAMLLVDKPERLVGAEARFLRKWLGWSGQDTAERLGFSPEHVSRWENDRLPISEVADKLLRSFVRMREPIDDYTEWDARMSRLAKSAPVPLSVRLEARGDGWARAA